MIKKELLIFTAIFLFLAIGMHFKEWTAHPLEHAQALPHAGAYGLGWIHPVVFTLAGYLLLGIIRLLVRGIRRLAKR